MHRPCRPAAATHLPPPVPPPPVPPSSRPGRSRAACCHPGASPAGRKGPGAREPRAACGCVWLSPACGRLLALLASPHLRQRLLDREAIKRLGRQAGAPVRQLQLLAFSAHGCRKVALAVGCTWRLLHARNNAPNFAGPAATAGAVLPPCRHAGAAQRLISTPRSPAKAATAPRKPAQATGTSPRPCRRPSS